MFVAVVLAACGEERQALTTTGGATTGGVTTTGPTGKPIAEIAVSEREYKLVPANPQIAKAGVVEFKATNDGKLVHALEVEGPHGEVETAHIQPGQSAEIHVDLDKPGRYEWYCPIDGHKELGMRGTVTVSR